MKAVRSRVKIYSDRVKKLEKAAVAALEKTTEYLHKEIVQAQVVPRDTGALQDEKFYENYEDLERGKTELVFEGPYARRLYYHPEYNFNREVYIDDKGVKHEGSPHAKGKWMEDWAKGGKKEKDVVRAFKENYRREIDL